MLSRQERVRLEPEPNFRQLGTDSGVATNQPCRDTRAMEPKGEQICGCERCQDHCRVLFRTGEQLVGQQANQEADLVDRHLCGLAPE